MWPMGQSLTPMVQRQPKPDVDDPLTLCVVSSAFSPGGFTIAHNAASVTLRPVTTRAEAQVQPEFEVANEAADFTANSSADGHHTM